MGKEYVIEMDCKKMIDSYKLDDYKVKELYDGDYQKLALDLAKENQRLGLENLILKKENKKLKTENNKLSNYCKELRSVSLERAKKINELIIGSK